MMPFFLQYSAKLLKKPDQCRAVYACSHLFWVDDQENVKDGERYSTVHLTFTMCPPAPPPQKKKKGHPQGGGKKWKRAGEIYSCLWLCRLYAWLLCDLYHCKSDQADRSAVYLCPIAVSLSTINPVSIDIYSLKSYLFSPESYFA